MLSRLSSPALVLLTLAASAFAADHLRNSNGSAEIFDIPSVVQVGEETVWPMNASNSVKWRPEHEELRVYLRAWSRELEEGDPLGKGADLYCVLTPCAWTNLTRIPITIPKDAFPSSATMITDVALYAFDMGRRISTRDLSRSRFELFGGTASWSDYERVFGWGAVSMWTSQLPCAAVPCARACIEEHLDYKVGTLFDHSREVRRAFGRCVEKCGPYKEDPNFEREGCITADAAAAASTTSTTPTTAPESPTASASVTTTTSAAVETSNTEGEGGVEGAASALTGDFSNLFLGVILAWLGHWFFR